MTDLDLTQTGQAGDSTLELRSRMWADLWQDALRARSAMYRLTERAELYLAAGLPLDRVLDALDIAHADWETRRVDLQCWKAENRAAGERVRKQMEGEA
ncbi:MAG: hypothetical protein M3Q68_08575 [Actinomycetota bacterium]|nr:hypothetical protein [Actinomycetota bacterium]